MIDNLKQAERNLLKVMGQYKSGQYTLLAEAIDCIRRSAAELAALRAELDEKNKFIEMAFVAHPNLDLDISYITNHEGKEDA